MMTSLRLCFFRLSAISTILIATPLWSQPPPEIMSLPDRVTVPTEGTTEHLRPSPDIEEQPTTTTSRSIPQTGIIETAPRSAPVQTQSFAPRTEQVMGLPDRTQRLNPAVANALRQAQNAYRRGDYALAQQHIEPHIDQLDSDGLILLGWVNYAMSHYAAATQHFETAYLLSATEAAARGLITSLQASNDYPRLLELRTTLGGPLSTLLGDTVAQAVTQETLGFTAEHEIASVITAPSHRISSTPTTQSNQTETEPNQGLQPSPSDHYTRNIEAAIRAFEAGKVDETYTLLHELHDDIRHAGEPGILVLLGFSARDMNDEKTALDALRAAAELTEEDEFYQHYAHALVFFDHRERAQEILQIMGSTPERDEQLAWLHYEQGHYSAAATLFTQAYRADPTHSRAQGLLLSLHAQRDYPALLSLLDDENGPLRELIAPEVQTQIASGHRHFALDADTHLQIAATTGTADPTLTLRAGLEHRAKQGTPGAERFEHTTAQVEATWQNQDQRIEIQVQQQHLDNAQQNATGQAFYARWHQQIGDLEYRVGLGRTPSGGLLNPQMIGEIGLRHDQEQQGLGLTLMRRDYQQSLLSSTGQRDPDTGQIWGQVLETGLLLDGYTRTGPWDALASLSLSELRGTRVADNQQASLYARTLRPVTSQPSLRLGPEFYGTAFNKNLSAFEPGHGGYFSPKLMYRLGGMAEYTLRLQDLQLTLNAGIGWTENQERAAPGNPLTGLEPEKYRAARNSGMAYHAMLQGLWRLNPLWELGFHIGGQTSPEYEGWHAGIHLEHHWHP